MPYKQVIRLCDIRRRGDTFAEENQGSFPRGSLSWVHVLSWERRGRREWIKQSKIEKGKIHSWLMWQSCGLTGRLGSSAQSEGRVSAHVKIHTSLLIEDSVSVLSNSLIIWAILIVRTTSDRRMYIYVQVHNKYISGDNDSATACLPACPHTPLSLPTPPTSLFLPPFLSAPPHPFLLPLPPPGPWREESKESDQ